MIVNPLIWYAERELSFVPRHFIKCPTPLNSQSINWVKNKITGRFAIAADPIVTDSYVYFEDQKDVTLYEIIWAGTSQ